MAIAFVQKITASGAGVNSQNFTLGGSTVAGNFLGLCTSVWISGGGAPNATPSGLGTWNTTTAPTQANDANTWICYNENCSAGTVVSIDYGTGFYIEGSLSEFSGLETSASLDRQTENSAHLTADDTPDTGNTAVTTQADELVLASLQVSNSETDIEADVPAATGYTNLHVQQNAFGTIGHSSDYKIVSGTGAQSASWGTINIASATGWGAKIATFKAAVVGTQNQIAWMTA